MAKSKIRFKNIMEKATFQERADYVRKIVDLVLSGETLRTGTNHCTLELSTSFARGDSQSPFFYDGMNGTTKYPNPHVFFQDYYLLCKNGFSFMSKDDAKEKFLSIRGASLRHTESELLLDPEQVFGPEATVGIENVFYTKLGSKERKQFIVEKTIEVRLIEELGLVEKYGMSDLDC